MTTVHASHDKRDAHFRMSNDCTLTYDVQEPEATRKGGKEHSQGGRVCMRSNAAVASASKHSTSVHLGLAADPIAQADYDMASYQDIWIELTPQSPVGKAAPPVQYTLKRHGLTHKLQTPPAVPPKRDRSSFTSNGMKRIAMSRSSMHFE